MFNIISADRPWTAYKFAPELLAWRDAVVGYGGSVSMQEMLRRNRLIHGRMASGAWSLIDDIWMAGETEIQSLVTLKRRFLCIRYNSPEFTALSGYRCDGYAKYIEWPFIPATHAVAMTGDNQRVAVWNWVNFGGNFTALGTSAGTGLASQGIRPLQNGVMRVTFGASTADFTLAVSESTGFSVGSRINNTTVRGYKDGVRLTDSTGLTIVPGLSPFSFFIGGQNAAGAALTRPLECGIFYAEVGAQLSDHQEALAYADVAAIAPPPEFVGEEE